MTSAFNFAAAPNTSAPTLPTTNRADPGVLSECPAPTGTLVSSAFSAGFPVPGTAQMPSQEALPGPVKRPSGIDPNCPRPAVSESSAWGAWILPAVGAGVGLVANLLRRRGQNTA